MEERSSPLATILEAIAAIAIGSLFVLWVLGIANPVAWVTTWIENAGGRQAFIDLLIRWAPAAAGVVFALLAAQVARVVIVGWRRRAREQSRVQLRRRNVTGPGKPSALTRAIAERPGLRGPALTPEAPSPAVPASVPPGPTFQREPLPTAPVVAKAPPEPPTLVIRPPVVTGNAAPAPVPPPPVVGAPAVPVVAVPVSDPLPAVPVVPNLPASIPTSAPLPPAVPAATATVPVVPPIPPAPNAVPSIPEVRAPAALPAVVAPVVQAPAASAPSLAKYVEHEQLRRAIDERLGAETGTTQIHAPARMLAELVTKALRERGVYGVQVRQVDREERSARVTIHFGTDESQGSEADLMRLASPELRGVLTANFPTPPRVQIRSKHWAEVTYDKVKPALVQSAIPSWSFDEEHYVPMLVPLGVDRKGHRQLFVNIEHFGSLLVAGTSEDEVIDTVRSIGFSMVFAAHPKFLRVAVVSRSEHLDGFRGIPHAAFKGLTPEQTVQAIWSETRSRRDLLIDRKRGLSARSVTEHNANSITRIPRLLVLADDLRDLIEAAPDGFFARAATHNLTGVHIVAGLSDDHASTITGTVGRFLTSRLTLAIPDPELAKQLSQVKIPATLGRGHAVLTELSTSSTPETIALSGYHPDLMHWGLEEMAEEERLSRPFDGAYPVPLAVSEEEVRFNSTSSTEEEDIDLLLPTPPSAPAPAPAPASLADASATAVEASAPDEDEYEDDDPLADLRGSSLVDLLKERGARPAAPASDMRRGVTGDEEDDELDLPGLDLARPPGATSDATSDPLLATAPGAVSEDGILGELSALVENARQTKDPASPFEDLVRVLDETEADAAGTDADGDDEADVSEAVADGRTRRGDIAARERETMRVLASLPPPPAEVEGADRLDPELRAAIEHTLAEGKISATMLQKLLPSRAAYVNKIALKYLFVAGVLELPSARNSGKPRTLRPDIDRAEFYRRMVSVWLQTNGARTTQDKAALKEMAEKVWEQKALPVPEIKGRKSVPARAPAVALPAELERLLDIALVEGSASLYLFSNRCPDILQETIRQRYLPALIESGVVENEHMGVVGPSLIAPRRIRIEDRDQALAALRSVWPRFAEQGG